MRQQRRIPTREKPYVTFAMALNYFDPDQRRMIDHIEKRTNYSDYMKRLVLRDLEGGFTHTRIEIVQEEDEIQMTKGLTSGLI